MAKAHFPPDRGRLEEAIARLAPIEREVLLLSVGEGLNIDQIAGRLGLSGEAATRHLAGALCALDRLLERPRPWWRFW
jgi:DNA-directed RNA polymerase specialized sigma24 family protein